MIKCIVFDLDGVLIDSKKVHFNSLNQALSKIDKNKQITFDEHLKIYDGLPTMEKLKILNKKNLLNKKFNSKVYKLKQTYTSKELNKQIQYNERIYKIFKRLSKSYKIAIATNAVKKTLKMAISKLKIKKFINYEICNEDVLKSKPHPEIYLRIILNFGLKPKEVVVIEDSHYGRMAAQESGCKLLPIKDAKDLNFSLIRKFIQECNNNLKPENKWVDRKMNILIPMAGAGKRFEKAGYTFPKPIIEIENKPMIQWVVESLNVEANYIFIIQKKHQNKFNLISVLKALIPSCKVIFTQGLTEGAACTALLAKKFINNNNPLIIANSDQFIEWDSSKTMYQFVSKKYDGGILTFKSIHPKWSFAKCDENNIVTEVAEKKVISNKATVGVYYWRRGKEFVKYSEQMIKNNTRVNNEFYICPVYNEAIKDRKKIFCKDIKKMHGLGTPEDLQNFLKYLDK